MEFINQKEFNKVLKYTDINKYYNDYNINKNNVNGWWGYFIKNLDNENKDINIKELVLILKKWNIYFIPIKDILYKKFLFVRKENGVFYYYFNYFQPYCCRFILMLEEANNKHNIDDFKLTLYSFKFKPMFGKNQNPNFKIFCPSQKKGYLEKPLISYYVIFPKSADKNNQIAETYHDFYKIIMEKNKIDYQINKAVFRGSENNNLRTQLFNLKHELLDIKRNDYIPFIDSMKYKYIIDIWGIDGHSGRRYWYLHFNRVAFFPKEDANKLFFEMGENKIKPGIHYVEYSVNNIKEIIDKIKYLEENPDEYEKIRNNAMEYAKKYLNYDSLLKLIKDTTLN